MQVNSNTSFLSSINLPKDKAEKELGKIASGKELQANDAAMKTIANALMSDANVLSQGASNANDGISMMQIADGALKSMSQAATNLETLSVASNNAALSSNQKASLQNEFNANVESMRSSMDNAKFNGNSLFGRDMSLSIGDAQLDISIPNVNLDGVELNSLESIQSLRDSLSSAASSVGSNTTSLVSSQKNLYSSITQKTEAYSKIADTDVADAVMKFKNNEMQLNASMIAQSHKNQLDQYRVMSLMA